MSSNGKKELDRMMKVDEKIREKARKSCEECERCIKELKRRIAEGDISEEIQKELKEAEKQLEAEQELAYGRD